MSLAVDPMIRALNAEWLSLALKEGDRVLAKAQTARVFLMQGADI